MNVQIKGMGHALPNQVLSNSDLEKMVDTSDEWIIERTGIKERRIAEPEKLTSDFCYEAAVMALDNAQITPEQLDLIIVATVTGDMLFPATSCVLQERLGAWNAAAFDLGAGCTGFIYGLVTAQKFLLTPEYNNILVVGGEILSRIVDYEDRNTCVLFGDGAGAAVLSRGNPPGGIIATSLQADGRGGKWLYIPGGGAAFPASEQTLRERMHYIKMKGSEVFRFASKVMVDVSERLLQQAGLGYNDIDFFVPHQANLRIIKSAMRYMNIPEEKVFINLDRCGNMSAASIPVALSMAEAEGRLKPGDLVLTVGFGAGLTSGGAIIRWGGN
ncbi:MAG: beta-ketoacyl-ACP synthase III [Syntrophomonadaceae bacterium]